MGVERSPAVAGRRRAQRMSGDERERVLLAAAERLLDERPLHELSVEEIARAAGLSRPTFYFYFASKDAVLVSLLAQVIDEAERRRIAVMEAALADGPAAVVRATIAAFLETFGAHRAVSLAVVDAGSANPEARELWLGRVRTWTETAATLITAERERGAAPAGIDAHDLATTLNLMNERVLQATLAGESPAVRDHAVVDTLTAVWLSAIYGGAAGTPPERP